MAESNTKRIMIVGIPGVGKTTVISKAAEILRRKGHNTTVLVFGSLMFEESKEMKLKNRDEMRKLSVEEQRRLQHKVADRIAAIKGDFVIIDTHLIINTEEGYYPGIPMHLLEVIKPTNIIMIAADPQEILSRRKKDESRIRDLRPEIDVQNELEISRAMIACCSVVSGCPFLTIMNNNNEIDKASLTLANVLSGDTDT
ncbi:MAG TPA: adenylate kinase [Candidatus Nitrosopolaris sp.]|nr:adenylate kinase [Candidatus Nitrosopolaris sp.]